MRSQQKELLDEDNISSINLNRNLYELEVINRLLGGHNATINGLKVLLKNRVANKPTTIVDIGCGGGDTLKVIASWAMRKNISVNLIGIDLKTEAIKYASQNCIAYNNISFIQSDYKDLPALNINADIYINSLFCHHLNDIEIISLLQFMQINSKIGFIINDLHRNSFAYYSIKLFTSIFSKSYLVKNDAPLSVLRGFKHKELEVLSHKALVPVKIKWKWAFRWLVTNKQNGTI